MTIRTQIHLCLCCMQEHTTIDIDVSSIYLLTNSKYIPVISGFIVSIPDGKKKGNREGNFISFSVILQDRPDLRFIGNVCLQRNHFPSKVHGFQIWKEFTIKDFITSFCGHLTYIEILWKLWNEEWIDPMEVFCSRHTFFLWPYMTTKKTFDGFQIWKQFTTTRIIFSPCPLLSLLKRWYGDSATNRQNGWQTYFSLLFGWQWKVHI